MSIPVAAANADAVEIRTEIRAWLAANKERLGPFRSRVHSDLEAQVGHESTLMALLHDSGWTRLGWPEDCGGLGGDEVSRAIVYDEINAAGLVLPEAFVLLETVAPPLAKYAPDLAARHLPRYLAGAELWAQCFSEPDAGSDLASIRTRAQISDESFVLNGQKVWSTLGQCAQWAAVLCRTGTIEEAHRGLTLLWVDLRSEGVSVLPIRASNGRNEFAELSFTDVVVPRDHTIGPVGEGWQVAMYLLSYERGMYAWTRQAALHRTLRDVVLASSPAGPSSSARLGQAFQAVSALRSRSGDTVRRLAARESLGPEVSIDKVLLSMAEQLVFDFVRVEHGAGFLVGDAEHDLHLRDEWFYSRATSIFGGAVDVQRGIVAERLMGLPRESRRG